MKLSDVSKNAESLFVVFGAKLSLGESKSDFVLGRSTELNILDWFSSEFICQFQLLLLDILICSNFEVYGLSMFANLIFFLVLVFVTH